MVSTYLAAFDPVKNLSIISLKDRRTLLEFLWLRVRRSPMVKDPRVTPIIPTKAITYTRTKARFLSIFMRHSLDTKGADKEQVTAGQFLF